MIYIWGVNSFGDITSCSGKLWNAVLTSFFFFWHFMYYNCQIYQSGKKMFRCSCTNLKHSSSLSKGLLILCFLQMCLLFPGCLSHHQKQEKDQGLRAICHHGHGQWFVTFTLILQDLLHMSHVKHKSMAAANSNLIRPFHQGSQLFMTKVW